MSRHSLRSFPMALSICISLLAASSTTALAEPTFHGLGALPAPFDESFSPLVRTPDGLGITAAACTGGFHTAECRPFRFIPYGQNAALSLLPGDTYGSAWATTSDRRVVVGFSQNNPDGHYGRTAVRWVNGGPPIPLVSLADSVATWPRAVSDDGSIISGRRNLAYSSSFGRAFVWTDANGYTELLDPGHPLLAYSYWVGQTDGGQVIAYLHQDYHFQGVGAARAMRWTATSGLELLGPMPTGYSSSNAVDIAESTGAVVGTLWPGSQYAGAGTGYLWSETGGMQILPAPASHLESRASAISSNGTMILGELKQPVSGGLETEAFRWSEAEGVVSLGPAPGFERTSPSGTTEHGTAIWGSLDSDTTLLVYDGEHTFPVYDQRIEKRSFVWTAAAGRLDLPHGLALLSNCDHDFWTQVEDVAADGHVAFGRTRCDAPDSFFEYFVPFEGWFVDHARGAQQWAAFAWDPIAGFRTTKDYLEQEYGVDLTDWEIDSISIDDAGETVLYGTGRHSGRHEGWVLYLPEPALGTGSAIGIVGIATLHGIRRRSSWCVRFARVISPSSRRP